MHNSITLERILEIAEESMMDLGSPGVCTACGAETDGCEPDARNYECDDCGEREVFGAEELLLMIV